MKAFLFLEPLTLLGEGSYNLNVVKDISATDEFLEMDVKERGCQVEIPYENCTTSKAIDSIIQKCHCLPSYLNKEEKVYKILVFC